MASNYIQFSQQEVQQLHAYLINANNNSNELERTFADIQKVTIQFSSSLKKIAERLHEYISKGIGESDTLESCYQYLSNFILQVAQQWQQISENIIGEIIEPYSLIATNFKTMNIKIASEAKESLHKIASNQKIVMDCQDEYIKLMSNADKSFLIVERTVDEVQKGFKVREDLIKASEKQIKQKELAIEALEDCKKAVDKSNKKLNDFNTQLADQYQQIIFNIDNRNKFSKQIILSLMKKMAGDNVYQVYLEKIQLLDQKNKQVSGFDLQNQILRLLKKNGIESAPFKCFEVVNYDQQKKENKHDQILDWQIVGDVVTEEELACVSNYVLHLFNTLEELDKSSDDSNSSFQQQRNRTYSSSSNKSVTYTQEFQIVKSLMQKQLTRNQLAISIEKELAKNKSFLIANDETYNELGALFKHIVLYLDASENDLSEIYQFLTLSTRITKISAVSLTKYLSEMSIWNNKQMWIDLFNYIQLIKFQNKVQQEERLKFIKKSIGLFGKGLKKIGFSQHHSGDIEKQVQHKYLILEEVTVLLTSLCLNPQLATDIILDLSFQGETRLEKAQLCRLLQKLEESNAVQFQQHVFSAIARKRKMEEKYKKLGLQQQLAKIVYCIKKSIVYLEARDKPENLLLLSKLFNQQLRQGIENFHLLYKFQPNNKLNQKKRIADWQQFFRVDTNEMDYPQMKSDAGQEIMSYEEIITMDVQRSLNIHLERLSSSKLQSLLRTYAYHHQEIGYCQGMNYIAGYIYLTFEDEEVAYKVFDYVMQQYFSPFFVKEFELMKLVFYQYERLFSIFCPSLYQHFKQQNIDPSYYLTSWFITVFSQVYQFNQESALLNIIWDIFIAQKWKGFYKCILFLLELFQIELLSLEFEQILHFTCDIIRHEVFAAQCEEELVKVLLCKIKFNPKKSIKIHILSKYRLTNSILTQLENEYNCFTIQFNQKLKQYNYK